MSSKALILSHQFEGMKKQSVQVKRNNFSTMFREEAHTNLLKKTYFIK